MVQISYRIIVPDSSSQISQNAQWNCFDDSFEQTLPADHHTMATIIGDGVYPYYESLLRRIRQILLPGRLEDAQQFQQLENEILHDVSIQRYTFSPSVDGPQVALPMMQTDGKMISAKFRPLKAPYIVTLFRFLNDAVKTKSRSLNETRKKPSSPDGPTVRWYHIRHCVGIWAPLVLSALALVNAIPLVRLDELTEDLWKSFLEKYQLRRPEWPFPEPSLKIIPPQDAVPSWDTASSQATVLPTQHTENPQNNSVKGKHLTLFLPYL